MDELLYEALKNYFGTLAFTGYKSYDVVNKLLVVDFIHSMQNSDLRYYMKKREDIMLIEDLLYQLLGSTCEISFPTNSCCCSCGSNNTPDVPEEKTYKLTIIGRLKDKDTELTFDKFSDTTDTIPVFKNDNTAITPTIDNTESSVYSYIVENISKATVSVDYPDKNYAFSGFYTDDTYTTPIDLSNYTLTEDTTVYALFTTKYFDLVLDATKAIEDTGVTGIFYILGSDNYGHNLTINDTGLSYYSSHYDEQAVTNTFSLRRGIAYTLKSSDTELTSDPGDIVYGINNTYSEDDNYALEYLINQDNIVDDKLTLEITLKVSDSSININDSALTTIWKPASADSIVTIYTKDNVATKKTWGEVTGDNVLAIPFGGRAEITFTKKTVGNFTRIWYSYGFDIIQADNSISGYSSTPSNKDNKDTYTLTIVFDKTTLGKYSVETGEGSYMDLNIGSWMSVMHINLGEVTTKKILSVTADNDTLYYSNTDSAPVSTTDKDDKSVTYSSSAVSITTSDKNYNKTDYTITLTNGATIDSNGNITKTGITNTAAVSVTYQLNAVTVTPSVTIANNEYAKNASGANINISLKSKTVTKGQNAEFTVADLTKTGYELTSVKVGNDIITSSGGKYTIYDVSANTTISLVYTVKKYNVTVNINYANALLGKAITATLNGQTVTSGTPKQMAYNEYGYTVTYSGADATNDDISVVGLTNGRIKVTDTAAVSITAKAKPRFILGVGTFMDNPHITQDGDSGNTPRNVISHTAPENPVPAENDKIRSLHMVPSNSLFYYVCPVTHSLTALYSITFGSEMTNYNIYTLYKDHNALVETTKDIKGTKYNIYQITADKNITLDLAAHFTKV